MPRRLTYALLALALRLAWPEDGHGQGLQQLATSFQRDVNRFRWAADAVVDRRFGLWEVQLLNRFTSEALVFGRSGLSFRDENLGVWRVGRRLRPSLELALNGQTAWFSQSEVFSQELYGGLRYRTAGGAWIEPALGFAWDRRPGAVRPDGGLPLRLDAGPAYALRFQAAPRISGYALAVEGAGAWQIINPRRGRMAHVTGSAQRALGAAMLGLDLHLSNLRRDAYQAASFLNRDANDGRPSETVEATATDTLLLGARLDAPLRLLGPHLRFSARVDFTANDRSVRTLHAPDDALFFDTDFSRRALLAEAAVAYERGDLVARLAAETGAEIEHRRLANRAELPPAQATLKGNLLRQADFDQGAFSLRALLRAPLTPRVTFSFDGSANIVRHDTPEGNDDDRDEVFANAQSGFLLRLSRYVQTELRVFGSFYHTVYLRAVRSAENNRQHVLRFRPLVRWTPSRATRFQLASEVRATYTVDDFVLEGRRPTDQSARELRYDAALEQDLPGGLRLLADGGTSTLLLGRLLWDDFAEIPFDTLRTRSAWVRLQAGRRWTATVGFRYFRRSDFERAATVAYPRLDTAGLPILDELGNVVLDAITRVGNEAIIQLGPTGSVEWPMTRGSRLRLDGWLQRQVVRQTLYGRLPEDEAEHIRRIARRGTRRLTPNLTFSVLWNL